MQFTVEQIRSVRNNYRDPPFPGFSLEEICRRRRLTQTKLVRGEHAWVAKGTAQTTEEWASRLVQGSLNKLSERNYDIMLDKLRTRELFATAEVLNNVVALIFKKALDEPENSKLYASMCFDLAMFEVSLNEQTGRPKSELRNAIVYTAQREFRAFRKDDVATEPDLTEEERERLRSNFMRRKRANMRFVGELFLSDVLSHGTMLTIMDVTMKEAAEGGFPASENIELLAELLTTVGEQLDNQKKKELDYNFGLLAGLIKRADNPYPHRIRFKIMDLLDLRKNGWGSGRPKAVKPPTSTPSPTSGKRPASVSSPTTKKGHSRAFPDTPAAATSASSSSWRDTAAVASERGGATTTATTAAPPPRPSRVASPSLGAGNTTNNPISANATTTTTSTATSPPPPSLRSVTTAPKANLVNFELRVRSMLEEWATDRSNDFIPQWIDEFNRCDREFATAEELCVAVAMEVIKEACTTTRKEAQREAYSFLIVGLFLTDEEVIRGFAQAMAAAMEDGLLEDVPKFPERFMQMLRFTSSEEETNADVYYDAANVMRMAYNKLSNPDDTSIATIMQFWHKVPQSNPAEERVILGFEVLYSLCDPVGAQRGLEKLLASIMYAMHDLGIVENDTVEELLSNQNDNELFAKVVAAYKQLL